MQINIPHTLSCTGFEDHSRVRSYFNACDDSSNVNVSLSTRWSLAHCRCMNVFEMYVMSTWNPTFTTRNRNSHPSAAHSLIPLSGRLPTLNVDSESHSYLSQRAAHLPFSLSLMAEIQQNCRNRMCECSSNMSLFWTNVWDLRKTNDNRWTIADYWGRWGTNAIQLHLKSKYIVILYYIVFFYRIQCFTFRVSLTAIGTAKYENTNVYE